MAVWKGKKTAQYFAHNKNQANGTTGPHSRLGGVEYWYLPGAEVNFCSIRWRVAVLL